MRKIDIILEKKQLPFPSHPNSKVGEKKSSQEERLHPQFCYHKNAYILW